VKLLVCEAGEARPLVAAARSLPYPYRVWRDGETYRLELVAPPEAAAELAERLGLEVRVLELVEEGCREENSDA